MNKIKEPKDYKAPRAELVIMHPESIICTSMLPPIGTQHDISLEEMSETSYDFIF